MLIRYYGHVGVPSGYGTAANEICMAMLEAGLDLEISTNGTELHQRYLPLASRIRGREALSPPDVILVHTLPMDCQKLLRADEVRQHPGAVTIAYTTWEGATSIPKAMAEALSPFDQVWVPSSRTSSLVNEGFAAAEIARTAGVVPHPYDAALWNTDENTWPRKADRYRFYFIGAHTVRKNIEGVIRAYIRAFAGDEANRRDVELVIQSDGADREQLHHAIISTGIVSHRLPLVKIGSARVADETIVALHRESHCFVTATRGEAWNLPAFDAMLAGNHIIAPGVQGSDDFLHETSADVYHSWLHPAYGDVRVTRRSGLPDGHAMVQVMSPQGMDITSDWREPNINHLSKLMRAAYDRRKDKLRVSYDPAERFGRAAVGAQIRAIISDALERKTKR